MATNLTLTYECPTLLHGSKFKIFDTLNRDTSYRLPEFRYLGYTATRAERHIVDKLSPRIHQTEIYNLEFLTAFLSPIWKIDTQVI